jgi:adenylate kinase family enzyme
MTLRPSKITIILRGLPGSGKSYLANLIKVSSF